VTRYAHGLETSHIKVIEAGHPVPDSAGELAAAEILNKVSELGPDDLLITKQLSNAKGEWTCDFRVDKTETQETINGGKIVRENAYIDLTEAKHIRQN
jgi:hypothetical protein